MAILQTVHSSTIGDILTRSARRAPHPHAIAFEDRTWTYRELDDAVTRAAAGSMTSAFMLCVLLSMPR